MKRDELLRDVTENNETIILLNNEIEEQIISMKIALEMIRDHKIKKINALELKTKTLERKLLSLPEKELELKRLEGCCAIPKWPGNIKLLQAFYSKTKIPNLIWSTMTIIN